MSLDLYQRETDEKIAAMPPVQVPETGAFDGFIRGAGLASMKGLAYTGRGIDILGSVGPIAKDAFTGGTVAQDKYFQEHDDIWGSAVDYWTPKPNEVGVAGEITGQLLSGLLQVIASPALAIGSLQLSTAEDLVKKGVDATKAQAVGAVQATGLGLGVWMPILGQNLWQRVVVGGAGFNVAQGVTTRAASQAILANTPGADEFKAFDGTALTLDVLMGAAFGGMVHLSPNAREQGAVAWERLQTWAEGLTPTQKSAIVALRQAQHLNVDSVPGIPEAPVDVEAHVNRVKNAIEQLERDQPVNVSDMPEPRVEVDEKRVAEGERHAEALVKRAESVRKAEDIPEITETEAPAANRGGEAEPPPPRGDVAVGEAAGAEADPWAVRQAPMPPRTIEDGDVRSILTEMAEKEVGWAEVGGKLIRVKHSEVAGDETLSRTKWIPKSDWWKGRPGGLNEQQTKVAVRKAVAGEKLNARERRAVDYMVEVANSRLAAMHDLGPEEWSGVMADLKEEGGEPTHQNAVDADLVARATRIDEGAIENAAMKYENDDAAFMAEVRRILDQAQQDDASTQGRQADRGQAKPGGEDAAASEEEVDPVRREAERLAAEEPDRLIRVGTEADGSPAVLSLQQYLDDASARAARLTEEAQLIEVAAACMLGKGA